jgi:uroporphyrinogen-III decarboxylase
VTERERILITLRGERADRIAWVPRLEFWLRGRKHTNTLPKGFEDMTLPSLVRELGVGWYGSIPDFTDSGATGGIPDRALGILRSRTCPYEVIHGAEVERKIIIKGEETIVEYITPVGSISTSTGWTEEMRKAGVSTSWISRHAIEGPEDIDVVEYIFSHLKVVPSLDGYLEFRKEVGDRGVVAAFTSGAGAPMQHIMRMLMPLEKFFLAMSDYPERLRNLAGAMEGYYRDIEALAAEAPGEMVLLGGNYDSSITYPPFFKEHILPHLHRYAQGLHERGKYLMTHTDGENRNLIDLYIEADFDIADSICPAPMTSLELDTIHDAFSDRITIWGGLPSTVLCPQSCGWDEFKAYVDRLLGRYGHERRYILGVSDMVTADADIDRVRYITDKVDALA